MAIEHEPVKCKSGSMSITSYFSGGNRCVQLTFGVPVDLYGKKHTDASNDIGYWFLNMTQDQARELAVKLFQFADDTLEPVEITKVEFYD